MRGYTSHRCSAKSGTLEDGMVVLDNDCVMASSVIPTASVHNRDLIWPEYNLMHIYLIEQIMDHAFQTHGDFLHSDIWTSGRFDAEMWWGSGPELRAATQVASGITAQ